MHRRLLRATPNFPRADALALRIAIARRDQPRVYLASKALGPIERQPPALRFTAAQASFTVGRIDEAIATMESIPIDGGGRQRTMVATWRLKILIQARRFEDAERVIDQLPKTPTFTGTGELARAEIALKRHEVDSARRILETIPDSESTPIPLRFQTAFLLARVYESLGDADSAFRAAQRGNRIHARNIDVDHFEAELTRTISRFNESRVDTQSRSSEYASSPTLIVGMPRSGTSLLEQILASHGDADGVGEQQTPFRLVEDIEMLRTIDPEDASMEPMLAESTRRYLEMHEACGVDGRRITNKALGMEWILGDLTRILPSASIIFIERDPRDLLLSIHQHPLSVRLYPWSTNLADISRAIKAFERLADHWTSVLPNPVLRLKYENLVESQETETNRLLDFLDLPPDPRCLAFERTDRTVLTPSADQLRRGMNRDGLGRWKRYRSHLGEFAKGR